MKILIIESDAAFAGRLQGALRQRGADVDVTGDGKDGLDRAKAERPEAIVLSVELGDKLTGGYAYCNKLKKDDDLRSIPLVLISSQATRETFEQHRKLKTRAEEYLIKPFEPEELIEKLAGHVELGQPEPEIEVEDPGEDALSVEDLEAFDLSPSPGPAPGGDDDLLKLDEAFHSLEGGEELPVETVAASADAGIGEPANAADLEELSFDDEPPPPPAERPSRLPTPGPRSAGLMRSTLTPGPAGAEMAMQIAELKGQVAELEARLESSQRELDEARSDGDARASRLEAELSRKDAAIKTAHARADVAQAQARKLEATLGALKADAGRLGALEAELGQLTAERDALEAKVGELENARAAEHARAEKLQRDLDTMRQELLEVRRETDGEADRLRGRLAELEGEASRNEERVLKAYQKIKGDERVKEKTKKALAIALQLLEEHPLEDEEVRS